MAHKKGQGASRNGRDSNPQFRGIKTYAGERVRPGTIILRQCGTKFKPGMNVKLAKDDSLFALAEGIVEFQKNKRVHVRPIAAGEAAPAKAEAAGE